MAPFRSHCASDGNPNASPIGVKEYSIRPKRTLLAYGIVSVLMGNSLRVSTLIALTYSFSAPVCFGQSPNALTTEEKRAGWELLFDGQTSQGWRSPSSNRFPDGFWVVDDGFLRGAPVGNRATDLMTAGVYRNFDLTFEWKIAPGGNSGVKYLVGSSQKLVFEDGKPPNIEGTVTPGPDAILREYTSGMEYQLVDEEKHPDGKESTTRSGSLYQLAGFDQNVVKPAGQLNHSRIVVNGNHIEHWVNGVRVVATDVTSVEFQQAAAKAPARTRRALEYMNKELPIALQSHTGAVWFRNLKLRRLPDAQ
jgi:hypothetical protein